MLACFNVPADAVVAENAPGNVLQVNDFCAVSG